MTTPLSSDGEISVSNPLLTPGLLFDSGRTDGVEAWPPQLTAQPGLKTRLRSAARSFTPLALQKDAVPHQFDHQDTTLSSSKVDTAPPFDHHFATVIQAAVKTMRESQFTLDVDVSDSLRDCAIIVQPDEDSVLIEQVLELAQHALLDAAAKTKPIYVVGSSTQQPFVLSPLGFEARLGAMEEEDSKHSACEILVRILVETCKLNAQIPLVCVFLQKVADFVTHVASTVRKDDSCARVQTLNNQPSTCWTIEITLTAKGRSNQEGLVTFVKSTLLMLVPIHGICILGYAAKPFIPRSNGYAVVLGSTAAETHACWHFYSQGSCREGPDCTWEHPHCSMPINIIIKSRS